MKKIFVIITLFYSLFNVLSSKEPVSQLLNYYNLFTNQYFYTPMMYYYDSAIPINNSSNLIFDSYNYDESDYYKKLPKIVNYNYQNNTYEPFVLINKYSKEQPYTRICNQSLDGTKLLIANEGGLSDTVILYDLNEKIEISRSKDTMSFARIIGDKIFGFKNDTLVVYNFDFKELKRVKAKYLPIFSYSSDLNFYFNSYDDNSHHGFFYKYDLSSNQIIQLLDFSSSYNSPDQIKVSKDGKYCIYQLNAWHISIMDLEKGKLIFDASAGMTNISISPSGRYFGFSFYIYDVAKNSVHQIFNNSDRILFSEFINDSTLICRDHSLKSFIVYLDKNLNFKYKKLINNPGKKVTNLMTDKHIIIKKDKSSFIDQRLGITILDYNFNEISSFDVGENFKYSTQFNDLFLFEDKIYDYQEDSESKTSRIISYSLDTNINYKISDTNFNGIFKGFSKCEDGINFYATNNDGYIYKFNKNLEIQSKFAPDYFQDIKYNSVRFLSNEKNKTLFLFCIGKDTYTADAGIGFLSKYNTLTKETKLIKNYITYYKYTKFVFDNLIENVYYNGYSELSRINLQNGNEEKLIDLKNKRISSITLHDNNNIMAIGTDMDTTFIFDLNRKVILDTLSSNIWDKKSNKYLVYKGVHTNHHFVKNTDSIYVLSLDGEIFKFQYSDKFVDVEGNANVLTKNPIIFPNPFKESITISNINIENIIELKVFDIFGNEIKNKIVNNDLNNVTLNIEENYFGNVYLTIKLKNNDLYYHHLIKQ